MSYTITQALTKNFLGNSPIWYKQVIIAFLIINPILLITTTPFITGWVLIAEFIFTLAMALKCYPLQPGGLLAIQAVIIGLAGFPTEDEPIKGAALVFHEVEANLKVILLLMFMVAGIYFMKDLLLYVFTKLLINIRSKIALSLLFSISAAVLSAFLDALTVTAVLIAVCVGFYSVYHKVASGGKVSNNDDDVIEYLRDDLEQFRAYLRSLVMHGAVGTALGGVCTLVGEPQNIIIAERAGWDFIDFFLTMAPVSIPVLIFGLLTCVLLEKFKLFGYGQRLPQNVRSVLEEFDKEQDRSRTNKDKASLVVQTVAIIILVLSLAFHIAEVGLVGLMIIILLTSFNGIVEEHQIGHAFEEALPFTALLVVFFAVVAVINEQNLFEPITTALLAVPEERQASMFFIANGLLSMISDNVFVATVYIEQITQELASGTISSKEHFDKLAIAINTGTNLPSVATPNGQAAFLFLLTSALAPLIRLSYGKMVLMALPYTIVMGGVGLAALTYFI